MYARRKFYPFHLWCYLLLLLFVCVQDLTASVHFTFHNASSSTAWNSSTGNPYPIYYRWQEYNCSTGQWIRDGSPWSSFTTTVNANSSVTIHPTTDSGSSGCFSGKKYKYQFADSGGNVFQETGFLSSGASETIEVNVTENQCPIVYNVQNTTDHVQIYGVQHSGTLIGSSGNLGPGGTWQLSLMVPCSTTNQYSIVRLDIINLGDNQTVTNFTVVKAEGTLGGANNNGTVTDTAGGTPVFTNTAPTTWTNTAATTNDWLTEGTGRQGFDTLNKTLKDGFNGLGGKIALDTTLQQIKIITEDELKQLQQVNPNLLGLSNILVSSDGRLSAISNYALSLPVLTNQNNASTNLLGAMLTQISKVETNTRGGFSFTNNLTFTNFLTFTNNLSLTNSLSNLVSVTVTNYGSNGVSETTNWLSDIWSTIKDQFDWTTNASRLVDVAISNAADAFHYGIPDESWYFDEGIEKATDDNIYISNSVRNAINTMGSPPAVTMSGSEPNMMISIQGNLMDLNPLHDGDLSGLALGVRDLLTWIVRLLFVLAVSAEGLAYVRALVAANQTQMPKIFGDWKAIIVVIVVVVVYFLAFKFAADTLIDAVLGHLTGLDWSLNEFSQSPLSAASLASALWLLDQFVPCALIVHLSVLFLVIRLQLVPVFTFCWSVIRLKVA